MRHASLALLKKQTNCQDDNTSRGFLVRGILKASFLVACLGMVGASHSPKVLCEGFAPKNNLNIPATAFADTGITQDQWTALFDRFEKIYTPIIASRGGTLQLNRLWDDCTVNANANQDGTTWTINMYGGLARYPTMTVDGMALVVCHETGHHLGGAPKIGGDATYWASNEGAADYFGVLKCMRHMFADDDNATIVSQMSVEPTIQKNCAAQFQDVKDQALCQRSATAGILLGHILGELGQEAVPSVDTPSQSVVDQTDDEHPAAQCRLDTYFQGANCTADLATFQDGADYHVGTCTAPTFKMGLRPTCWFKPDAADTKLRVTSK